MTSLEHKFYLADLERSALNTNPLPRLPRALVVIMMLVGLSAVVGLTTLA